MDTLEMLRRIAQPREDAKVVLLVLDGIGDLRTAAQPRTALDLAVCPNLDGLAARSALGRIVPAGVGVTPGSGPGHLALFGYDPTLAEHDIGRGILEALGLGLEPSPRQVAARGNFASADADGRLTDRRAGRIPTEECVRLCGKLSGPLAGIEGVQAEVHPGEGHRFVLLLDGEGLDPRITDTDPQRLGVPPLAPEAEAPEAEESARLVARAIEAMNAAIADEPKANRVLLRGFSRLPELPQIPDLYHLRAGAFAGYPLYRGVARACGMEVVECGKRIGDLIDRVEEHWERFDYFFLHVKRTDQTGEDGDVGAKAAVVEEVDRALPRLTRLGPEVLAITGDHSTPAPMKSHSWHPVPLLLAAPTAFVDEETEYTEVAAARGHLGTFPAHRLMGLMLAHAGRLAKFGA